MVNMPLGVKSYLQCFSLWFVCVPAILRELGKILWLKKIIYAVFVLGFIIINFNLDLEIINKEIQF